MEAITTAIGTVFTLTETMLTSITSNAILVVVFASGFVSLALRVLRKAVGASKSVG